MMPNQPHTIADLESDAFKAAHLKHVDGFRRLAQTMASVCISLGAFALALLVYIKNSPSTSFQPPYIWLWLLQFVGISLIFCSALCTDWIIDSFTQEEWDAAHRVSPELDWGKYKIPNQVSERLSLFSTGYFLFAVSNCLLVGAMIYYFWINSGNVFMNIALFVLPLSLLAKMLTQTLLPSQVLSTIIFVLLLLVYGGLSFWFGNIAA